MSLFSVIAPRYFYNELPVIPLYRNDIRPVPSNWALFHDGVPPKEQQEEWIESFKNNNIGLVLGEQANICMLDIPTDDPGLLSVLRDFLPESPWERTGHEGLTLAFRFNPQLKNFRIRDTNGTTYAELLGSRCQLPLPPSIHPHTGDPYVANRELLECLGDLKPLPDDIEEVLRGAVEDYLVEHAGVRLSHSGWSKVTDYVSPGTRDVVLTRETGNLSWSILRGERTLVEALDMLKAVADNYDGSVAGPPVDLPRYQRELVNYLHRDIREKTKVLPIGWDDGLEDEVRMELGADFGVDAQGWTFEQTRTWLYDRLRLHHDSEEDRLQDVDDCLRRIAMTDSLTTLEQDRIFRFIMDCADVELRLTTLRRRLKELRGGVIEGNDQTEVAEAAILDLKRMYTLRFHDDRFWYWGGSHWEELDRQIIMQRLSDAYGHLPVCKRWGDMWSIVKIMAFKLQQGICDLEVTGVNFANGFLTKELKLLDHKPEYGMTYTLPIRYLAEEKNNATQFFRFLEQIWGHCPDYHQKLEALQEAMAVTLFGLGPTYQRAILLQGLARSGKSQLLRIVACLVPDNARSAVPPHDWGDKFIPTQMYQKLLNIAGELHEYKAIDGQRFKDIVDGSEMVGQFKGRDVFNFFPQCTHWFASNHYPKTGDTSDGFNRRWLVLEFDKQVRLSEIQRNLGDHIVAEEREAIIAWVVQGMPRILKNRDYTLPDSHRNVMNEVANLNNSVRFFIVESPDIKVGPVTLDGEKISTHIYEGELYTAYCAFCTAVAHVKPVGARSFRAKMKELGAELGFTVTLDSLQGITSVKYGNLTLVQRMLQQYPQLTMESIASCTLN